MGGFKIFFEERGGSDFQKQILSFVILLFGIRPNEFLVLGKAPVVSENFLECRFGVIFEGFVQKYRFGAFFGWF